MARFPRFAVQAVRLTNFTHERTSAHPFFAHRPIYIGVSRDDRLGLPRETSGLGDHDAQTADADQWGSDAVFVSCPSLKSGRRVERPGIEAHPCLRSILMHRVDQFFEHEKVFLVGANAGADHHTIVGDL